MCLDAEIAKTLRCLKANNFDARFAEDINAAKRIILNSLSPHMTVGIADSATIRQIGIADDLEKAGIMVLNPFSRELTTDPSKTVVRDDISRNMFLRDVLLVGTNAVTEDGKLVNMDAVGNRVASMIFGPRKVFIVAGKNKIVRNLDEAFNRIRNVIAPFHARTKQFATPCAKTGTCSDCNAPKRICNVTTIMEKKPWRTEISVIIVDDDLGLSWDETWSRQRIEKIQKAYKEETWVFASAKTQD